MKIGLGAFATFVLGIFPGITVCGGHVSQQNAGQESTDGSTAGAGGIRASGETEGGTSGDPGTPILEASRDEYGEPPPPDQVPKPPPGAPDRDGWACSCAPGGTVVVTDGPVPIEMNTGTTHLHCTDAPWLTFNTCRNDAYFQIGACSL